nr:oligosaccharide flippase family protein [Paraferrimonas sedimenticola]
MVKNILWASFDRILVLGAGLIAYILVSRFLGPEMFGKISFGLAISVLGISLSQFGANHIIFNLASKRYPTALRMVKASSSIRLSVYLAFTAICSSLLFYWLGNAMDVLLISVVILSQVFVGLDIYQYLLEGSFNSKKNAKANVISRLLAIFLRYLLIFFSAEVLWFVVPYFVAGSVSYVLKRKYAGIVRVRNNRLYSAYLITNGKYFAIAGVMAFLYTKISEILLGTLLGFEESGIFGVGVTIGFAATFFPLSIGHALLSKGLAENDLSSKFVVSNFLMIVSFLPVIIILGLFGEYLVDQFLGKQYSVLGNYIWLFSLIGLCSVLSVINNRYIGTFSNGSKYLIKKVILAALIAPITSYFLIIRFGLAGAIYSLLLVEFLQLTIFNYPFRSGLLLKQHFRIFRVRKFTV